jgi:hypothetical protein
MTEASLRKILNSGTAKYNQEELKLVISILKRLADIEHSTYLKKKNQ